MERLSWFTSERCSIRHRSHHVTTIASHSCSTPLIKLHFSRLRFRSMTRSVMWLSAIRQLALACWKSVLIFPRFLCAGWEAMKQLAIIYRNGMRRRRRRKATILWIREKRLKIELFCFRAPPYQHTDINNKSGKHSSHHQFHQANGFLCQNSTSSLGGFFSCASSSAKIKREKASREWKDSRNVVILRTSEKNNSRSFKVTLWSRAITLFLHKCCSHHDDGKKSCFDCRSGKERRKKSSSLSVCCHSDGLTLALYHGANCTREKSIEVIKRWTLKKQFLERKRMTRRPVPFFYFVFRLPLSGNNLWAN